jgi:hypothetical protein
MHPIDAEAGAMSSFSKKTVDCPVNIYVISRSLLSMYLNSVV